MNLEEKLQYYIHFLKVYAFKKCSFFLVDNKLYYVPNCCVGKNYRCSCGSYIEYFRMYDVRYIPSGEDVLEMIDLKHCEDVVLLQDKDLIFHLMLEDLTNDRL